MSCAFRIPETSVSHKPLVSSEEMHNPSSGGKVTALSLQVCVGCDTQKGAGDRDCMAQHSLGADETLSGQDIDSTCG